MFDKQKKFYQKKVIANFFNWLAVRIFKVTKVFCYRLIKQAVILDPSRKIFQENLRSFFQGEKELTLFNKRTYNFYSLPEGCKLLSKKITFIEANTHIKMSVPKVVNPSFKISQEYASQVNLPNTYLAELDDVIVVAGTDLIITNEIGLYDSINTEMIGTHSIKSWVIDSVSKKDIVVKLPKKTNSTIKCGVHFLKDYSKNYFHWIIECLPRLSLLKENFNNDIPLLIDENLPSQSLEALELLIDNTRPIIKLKKTESYLVKKLYYPSSLSVICDNYNEPNLKTDIIYSPKAINFVRDQVLKKYNIKHFKPWRKIYFSRKNSDYRQLLNSNEVENFLIKEGFEIVFLENLSFFAQVHICTQAKIIVGQSGAGMANLIFAAPECKILIMVSDLPQNNLHLFNGIAQAVGVDLQFLLGEHIYIPKNTIHADFYINIELLSNYLKNL